MSKTTKLVKCPKCSSTELYGTRKIKQFFTINQEETDFFNSEIISKKDQINCNNCDYKYYSSRIDTN
jgi:DNA-directed RNA polymerase subunit RPC12/RpoP